ncbi:MAG: hypothetical protein ACFFFY_01770, partial [Promethearchaeota archaeon]
IKLWSLFFNLCWIVSFPILVSFALIIDKKYINDSNVKNAILKQVGDSKRNISQFGLVMTFFANFLIWGDKLLEYPFTSWVLTKYGESGFFNYSYLFFYFTYLYMGGWFISRRLINQYKSRM